MLYSLARHSLYVRDGKATAADSLDPELVEGLTSFVVLYKIQYLAGVRL